MALSCSWRPCDATRVPVGTQWSGFVWPGRRTSTVQIFSVARMHMRQNFISYSQCFGVHQSALSRHLTAPSEIRGFPVSESCPGIAHVAFAKVKNFAARTNQRNINGLFAANARCLTRHRLWDLRRAHLPRSVPQQMVGTGPTTTMVVGAARLRSVPPWILPRRRLRLPQGQPINIRHPMRQMRRVPGLAEQDLRAQCGGRGPDQRMRLPFTVTIAPGRTRA